MKSTDRLTIPRTKREAIRVLTDLGGLVVASEWKRAAIVAALVGPAPGSGRENLKSGFSDTLDTLSKKGIVGLTHPDTIARYRDAWCSQRPAPALGDDVDLSGLPDWPPTNLAGRNIKEPERRERLIAQAKEDGVGQTKVLDIASNPKAMAAAIKADPKLADAAAKAVLDSRQRDTSTAEGREFREKVNRTNAASKGIVGNLGEALDAMNRAQEEFDQIGGDLSAFDRQAAYTILNGLLVRVESFRMAMALDVDEEATR